MTEDLTGSNDGSSNDGDNANDDELDDDSEMENEYGAVDGSDDDDDDDDIPGSEDPAGIPASVAQLHPGPQNVGPPQHNSADDGSYCGW